MTKQLYLHNPPQPVEAIVVKGKQWVHCHSTTQHHNLYNVSCRKKTKQNKKAVSKKAENKIEQQTRVNHGTKPKKESKHFLNHVKERGGPLTRHESPAQIKA